MSQLTVELVATTEEGEEALRDWNDNRYGQLYAMFPYHGHGSSVWAACIVHVADYWHN